VSRECPYCATLPARRPLTLQEDRDGVYHTHYCPALQREWEDYKRWKIEIGDPYFAKDPGAWERRLRYLKAKKLIP
jgi:hypothetical protein